MRKLTVVFQYCLATPQASEYTPPPSVVVKPPRAASVSTAAMLVVQGSVTKALLQVQGEEHLAEVRRMEAEFREVLDTVNKDWQTKMDELVDE